VTRLRALVLDDEPPVRTYLAELLRATERVEPIAVVGTAAEATQALEAGAGIDVAFVDVRLVDRTGDRSGLVWAAALAARPEPPSVVLATALVDHAVAAFDVGAIDYLLKPFTRSRVAVCVDRLVARRAVRVPSVAAKLMARDGARLVFLAVSGILAFEAAERLVFVHHAEGRFVIDLSLTAVEAQFAGRVLRTHRNWVVVTDQVRELHRRSGELVVIAGSGLAIPVSRDRGPAVREALIAGAVGAVR